MSTIFSTSFAQSYNGAGVDYTVPAGKVAVLRSITATNRLTTGVVTGQLRITSSQLIIFQVTLAASEVGGLFLPTIFDMHVVINAGQHLEGMGAVGLDSTVSGYLLSG